MFSLKDVQVVRYESYDPVTVRVVPCNLKDMRSRAEDYKEEDAERLRRDSFVVHHTDLVRGWKGQMEDEFDHRCYQKYQNLYRPSSRILMSGKGKAASSEVKQSPSLNLKTVRKQVASLGLSAQNEQTSQVTKSRTKNLQERELWYEMGLAEHHNEEFDEALNKEWEDYKLLFGEDKKRLLTNINETLPNIGRISSNFVFLLAARLPVIVTAEGSGCIISDDGRFVLTAGHVVENSFDVHEIIQEMNNQYSDQSRAQRMKFAKIIRDRAVGEEGKVYQTESEKKLNRHTFYRCHKFERDGVSNCQDEIKAKAFHVHPKYAKAMKEESKSQWFFQRALDSVFGDNLTVSQRMERFDFGILELEQAPKEMKDLRKVAFGMISHVKGQEQMNRMVKKIKVGLWGYSLDKQITKDAKKGTVHDRKASADEAKVNVCDELDVKELTNRCWGHSAPIFYDPEQVKDFNVLLSVTDSWHGVSGSPLWFMDNEVQDEYLEDSKLYLEPKTNRRIIGGVASCFSRKYHLTPKYIQSRTQNERLNEEEIEITLDQACVFDDNVVDWIAKLTGQKCHRAKYEASGTFKWTTGPFYLNKREQKKR